MKSTTTLTIIITILLASSSGAAQQSELCSNESIVGRNDRIDVKNGSGTQERPALHSYTGTREQEQVRVLEVITGDDY